MNAPDPIPTGTPVPDDPADPIERLRTYVLQKLLRGVPRGQIEDELIAKGYDVQYSIQLVDSVKRNAERKGGAALLDELPELPPAVQFEEAREQVEAMAVFNLTEENAVTRRSPRRSENVRRLFLVLFSIGLVLLLGGLIIEWRFWFVWLTGARVSGVVTRVEDRVILQPYSRKDNASPAEGYNLKATHLEYTFPTAQGNENGHVWLDSTSKDWETGMSIDVMYSRLDASMNMPSSLQFRVENDTVWFMAQLACILGAVLACVGFLGRRRMK